MWPRPSQEGLEPCGDWCVLTRRVLLKAVVELSCRGSVCVLSLVRSFLETDNCVIFMLSHNQYGLLSFLALFFSSLLTSLCCFLIVVVICCRL